EDHYNPVYDSNTSVDFAELSPNIVVRTHYGAPRGSRSTDSGKTWTDFSTHPSAADNDPGLMAISANGQRLVWAFTGFPAMYSTNNGATWTQCGGNITPTYSWERPFLFSDRVNSNKFYLYMPSTGVVHLSTDGGANFVAGPTLSTWCETMRAVYGLEGHIWISSVDGDSSKAGLWRSTNSGVSFTKISGVQNAQCIGFGRTASGSGHPVLYMGGQVNNTWGIFRSEDLATNWTRINDDQHQYGGISQITGDPKIYGRCYFGGRGLLYGDIPNTPQITKMIYQDSLVDGWENWSWATTDTASATPVWRGTSAISVTADGWAALSLHRQAVQSTVGYSAVAFWIHGGQSGGQPLQVVSLRSGNTQVYKPIPPPLAGTWTRVVIPLSELALANVSDFDGLWIQNASGSAISTFHVDDVSLVGEADAGTSAPPAPGGLAATAGNAQVALTWNASSGATDYIVKRATVNGGPYSTITSVTGTSFTNTGLVNGTTYYYVVSALNGFGESANSSQTSATPVAPPAAPPTPGGLATTAGNAQVGLTWNASSGATTYNVKRATVNGGPYSTITSVTETGFTDTGLTNGTTYYYVVSASNSGGESGNSTQASATPQAPPPPDAPTGFAATGGNTQAGLNWNASSGATSYNVKRATVSGGPYTTVGNVTNTSFTNTGLTNGTTYYYVVSALGTGGESANSAQTSATPQVPAPPAPAGLVATGGNTQVALTWNTASGATSYNVKRATVSGGPYSTITNITGTSFTNTGLTNGTIYYYVISALNGGGESPNSTQASATPSAPLPSPWATADIGAVAATGSASASGGIFTVTGSGADIWNASDEFRYVHQPSSGNCEMRAQVTSVQNTDPWAKAGVMIRESTTAGAIYAAVFITPGNGVTFQRRTATGGTTVNTVVTGVTAPRYVRLERAANNSFRAYYSSNGTSWTQIGSNQTINMA
ncbi:fibronectin type III domain-containing protein, partial [Flavobacterium sp.]|uniref:fibronectin type III domain-containing protein n=1 Tax=Flavobacterium sp. TaxID=239 RepID=UPI0032641B44